MKGQGQDKEDSGSKQDDQIANLETRNALKQVQENSLLPRNLRLKQSSEERKGWKGQGRYELVRKEDGLLHVVEAVGEASGWETLRKDDCILALQGQDVSKMSDDE
eukprot:185597-Hanusia_phi.AAC.1